MNTNVESVLKVIASVVLLHRKQNEFYFVRALPSNNLCSQHRQINEHADQSSKKNRAQCPVLLLDTVCLPRHAEMAVTANRVRSVLIQCQLPIN